MFDIHKYKNMINTGYASSYEIQQMAIELYNIEIEKRNDHVKKLYDSGVISIEEYSKEIIYPVNLSNKYTGTSPWFALLDEFDAKKPEVVEETIDKEIEFNNLVIESLQEISKRLEALEEFNKAFTNPTNVEVTISPGSIIPLSTKETKDKYRCFTSWDLMWGAKP